MFDLRTIITEDRVILNYVHHLLLLFINLLLFIYLIIYWFIFQPPYSEDIAPEFPEVEYFSVNLAKDAHQGLGITIAGYVGRENTPGNIPYSPYILRHL